MISRFLLAALFAAAPQLAGPDLEREARQIETMLVAPCCWNQQVSEHRSPASDEVKREVRALLAAGRTRQQVVDVFVERYGNRVLAEPPAVGFTRFLYLTPWLVFAVSALGLAWLVRRLSARRVPPEEPAVAGAAAAAAEADYQQRLDDELRDMD